MKILPCLLLFSMICLTLGCKAKAVEVKDSQEIKVKPCGFDYDIDNYFCKKDKIDLYGKYIGNKVNYNKNYTIIKINDGEYYRLVALDQRKKIVYPLNSQIVKNSAVFDYSDIKSELCIMGDFYSYRDTYLNSKICYELDNGYFIKKSIVENFKINTIKTPNSSNYFSNCLNGNSQKRCENLEKIENKLYLIDDIRKLFPDLASVMNDTKIRNLNVDGFRFLPEINNSFYAIAEKNIDTDEEAISEFYLIKIKPTIETRKIGNYYSINNAGVISYKDQNGKLKTQLLK